MFRNWRVDGKFSFRYYSESEIVFDLEIFFLSWVRFPFFFPEIQMVAGQLERRILAQ